MYSSFIHYLVTTIVPSPSWPTPSSPPEPLIPSSLQKNVISKRQQPNMTQQHIFLNSKYLRMFIRLPTDGKTPFDYCFCHPVYAKFHKLSVNPKFIQLIHFTMSNNIIYYNYFPYTINKIFESKRVLINCP